MNFEIKNTHLGISQNDVKASTNLNDLRYWKEEVMSQVIVMDNKIRKHKLGEGDMDEKNVSSTIHAKSLQELLYLMIDNRIQELVEERTKSMEALYFSVAEQELPSETHEAILNKARDAYENNIWNG